MKLETMKASLALLVFWLEENLKNNEQEQKNVLNVYRHSYSVYVLLLLNTYLPYQLVILAYISNLLQLSLVMIYYSDSIFTSVVVIGSSSNHL